MTDYTNLLERLAVSAGDQECLHADAKAAIEALQTRVAEAEDTNKALRVRLGSELERANELVADLQAECSELRGMAGAMDMLRSDMIDSGVIDINVPPMFFSESVIPRLLRLADMEKLPLYAAPPVAAPVRPNDSELEMIARAHGTGGWQTLGDMVTFARAIESAVLRANGFKLEGEQ